MPRTSRRNKTRRPPALGTSSALSDTMEDQSFDRRPNLNGSSLAAGPSDSVDSWAGLESLSVAAYAVDKHGRVTFFNEAAAVLWGRRPKLRDEKWCGSLRLFSPNGQPMAHEEGPLARSLRSGRPVDGEEAVVERPDGVQIRVRAYPTVLRDPGGDVSGALNILVNITEHDATEQRLRGSEARYRSIYQNMRASVWEEDFSGVVALLEEIRADGVTDPRAYFHGHPERLAEAIGCVRVTDINDFSLELFGAQEKDELLNSLAVIFLPRTDEIFIEELLVLWDGRRHFESETVLKTLDGRQLDVLFTIAFEGERCESTLVVIHDISAIKAAERAVRAERRHFRTLNKVAMMVASDLDLDHVVQSVTDAATELVDAEFGAFFYDVTDDKGEKLLLYTLSGAPREAFEKLGLPRNTALFEPTFRGSGVVRSDDIREDPRYGRNAPHFGMPKGHLPVVSYLAVPVVSRSGKVLGGLFFGHPVAGVFTEESELLVAGIAGHAAAAIDNARLHEAAQAEISRRQRAEEAHKLLLNEFKHRVKNTLAMIQGLASQTFPSASSEEQESFTARLQALSGAYEILTNENWHGAAIGEVVNRALAPFQEGHEERFQISGDPIRLDTQKSVLLAMAIHELATNALKYGALSNAEGVVSLTWQAAQVDHARRVRVEWRELGGPPVTAPTRRGFGTKLIEQALKTEGGGAELTFARRGVTCALEIEVT